jgi:hypothetical protein
METLMRRVTQHFNPAIVEVYGQDRIRGMCSTTNIPDICKYTINPQEMEMMQGKK